jgi:chemotaxis protein MotA
MAARAGNGGSKLDFSTVLGLLVSFGGIVGGLILEGGRVTDVSQATGALIVFGGTLGAVMVTTPPSVLIRAFKATKLLFFQPSESPSRVIGDLLEYGKRARRNGIVSLEQDVEAIDDPFLRKALSLGVDGTDLQDLRSTMELEIAMEEQRGRSDAKVFEAAGGYAPTIGIIGAVLGLIQVMKHLENIDEVGRGIAIAFVATVYGVGSANLLFLPAASKIKSRVEQSVRMKELMLEGVSAIVQGLHPKVMERKLEAYIREDHARVRGEGVRSRRLSEEASEA